MAKYSVLPADMVLYSPQEPKGRRFLAGETWPGDAWSDRPQGDAVGAETAAQLAKDLEEANSRLDRLGQTIESAVAESGRLGRELNEARGEIARLTQVAADAEAAKAAAEQQAREAVARKDQAVANESGLRQRIAALEEQIAAFDGDGDGKIGGRRRRSAEASAESA